MSYDRKIDFVCPHVIREEALFLEDDRRTVTPLRPIAAASSVQIRLDRLIEVPSYGVSTPAVALSRKRGPFNIVAGVSDSMVIEIAGVQYTLTSQAGQGLSAKQVVDSLNRSIPMSLGIKAVLSPKKKVNLQTLATGPRSTLMIRSGGLATVLGFRTQYLWSGKRKVPGWSLVRDPNTLADRPTQLIVFDEPLKGALSFVEADYATIREECRRCGGVGVEQDWRYGVTGDLVEVHDEALLIQEFQKFVFTVQGSNPFHDWYGTSILTLVGQKLSDVGVIQNQIVGELYEGFRSWQSIKKQQEDQVGQRVTDKEFPFRLAQVVMEPSQQDPTVAFISATLYNRSSEEIQIERGIKIPEPVDILGSTAQQGVFRQSLRNSTLVG